MEKYEPEQIAYSLDEVADQIGLNLAKMIINLGEMCQEVTKNGVPGHTEYEQIEDLLASVYQYIKEDAEKNGDGELPLKEKSFDNSSSDSVMSSQRDSLGGLFIKPGSLKPNINEKCPLCSKMASEEIVSKCDNPQCPYDWLQAVETKE